MLEAWLEQEAIACMASAEAGRLETALAIPETKARAASLLATYGPCSGTRQPSGPLPGDLTQLRALEQEEIDGRQAWRNLLRVRRGTMLANGRRLSYPRGARRRAGDDRAASAGKPISAGGTG